MTEMVIAPKQYIENLQKFYELYKQLNDSMRMLADSSNYSVNLDAKKGQAISWDADAHKTPWDFALSVLVAADAQVMKMY